MPSNSLPDANLNLPEMKTNSLSCPSGRVHMYDTVSNAQGMQLLDLRLRLRFIRAIRSYIYI